MSFKINAVLLFPSFAILGKHITGNIPVENLLRKKFYRCYGQLFHMNIA